VGNSPVKSLRLKIPFEGKRDFAKRFLVPLTLVVAATAAVGTLAVRSLEAQLFSSATADIAVFLEERFDIINTAILGIKRSAYEIAHVPEVSRFLEEDDQAEREMLGRSIRLYSDRILHEESYLYSNMLIVDSKGFVSFSFSRDRTGADYSDSQVVRSALRGSPAVDGPFIYNGQELLLVASPIFNQKNRNLGVAILEIDFRKFAEKIVRINQGARFSYGLFTHAGKVITKTPHAFIRALVDIASFAPEILPATNESARQSGFLQRSLGGHELLFVYMPFPGSGWFLFGSMPRESIFEPSRAISLAIVALGAFAVFITALVLVRTGQLKRNNAKLGAALEELASARAKILHGERIEASSQAFADIAHNLNTPIGNALAASSHAVELLRALSTELESPTPRRSVLRETSATLAELLSHLLKNERQAAEQLNRFKRIAADEIAKTARPFDVAKYLEYLVRYFSSQLATAGLRLVIDCARRFSVVQDPSAWTEMVSLCIDIARTYRAERDPDDVLAIHVEIHPPERIDITARFCLSSITRSPSLDESVSEREGASFVANPLRALSLFVDDRFQGTMALDVKSSNAAFTVCIGFRTPVSLISVDSNP
jgi:signal transduction histidine kinase